MLRGIGNIFVGELVKEKVLEERGRRRRTWRKRRRVLRFRENGFRGRWSW